MRVLVIEDSEKDREMLEQSLSNYFRKQLIDGTVFCYQSAEDFLSKNEVINIDILFLDVKLPGMNGIEFAQKICEQKKDILIILITNTVQYAINGYSFGAFDFILKPIDSNDFTRVMDRALSFLSKRNQTLMINYKNVSKKIAISNILYIEVFGHYIYIHHLYGTDKQYATLKSIENELPHDLFAKCNQSTVVNLSKIEKIIRNDVWINGEKIAISRRTKKEFMERFILFEGG